MRGRFDTVNTQSLGFDDWALDRIDQQPLLGEPRVDGQFRYAFNGTGVHVYIMDDGIDDTHVEFAGRIGDGTTVIRGFGGAQYSVDAQHGISVASAAVGSHSGAAKGAIVHSVQISKAGEPGPWLSTAIAGMDWIQSHGIRPAVVNMSWVAYSGQWYDFGYQAHVDNLIGAGFVVVKAAGNSGQNACDDHGNRSLHAIVVAASDQYDQHANWGGPAPTGAAA